MTITGRELEFHGNTVSDAECYDYCKWYTSWDYDDVDSKVTLCNASVRRSTNGDCYLHAKGIEAAEPTNMKTYVTHCPESTAPSALPTRLPVCTRPLHLALPAETTPLAAPHLLINA